MGDKGQGRLKQDRRRVTTMMYKEGAPRVGFTRWGRWLFARVGRASGGELDDGKERSLTSAARCRLLER